MNAGDLQRIKSDFLDALVKDANLAQLCDLAERYCNIPVAITLPTRTIIAKSKNYTQELLDEFTNHMSLSSQDERTERQSFIEDQLAKQRAFIGSYPFMRFRHINCGCFRENHLLGVLDCPVTKSVNTEETLALVETIAPVFLSALQLNGYITRNTMFSMQVFLSGLLHNESKMWLQQKYVYGSPLETIKNWRIIWSPPVGEECANRRGEELKYYCARNKNIWFADYQDGVVLLANADLDYDWNALVSRCGNEITISVSESFDDLDLLMNHLHAAQRTICLAKFEGTTDRVVFVENYKMPIAFLVLKRHPNQMVLIHPLQTKIQAYDKAHGSDYYLTLKTYLLCNMDSQKIAEKLHIHKNTVNYRLQRMMELFDMDLKDCRTITALYLGIFDSYDL